MAEASIRVIARRPATLLTAAILLALCVLTSLFAGSSRVPAGQVAHYLPRPDVPNTSYNINVLRVRRTIMGVLMGAALAVTGTVMQAVAHNPLTEPGLLGINAGASLDIILETTVLGVLPIFDQLALAAGGALVTTALVQAVGMIGTSSSSPVHLVLIGVVFSAFAGTVIRGIVLTMPNLFRILIGWEVSSLTRIDVPPLPVAALVVAGTGATTLLTGALDNIALGDDVAAAPGTQIALARSLSLVVVMVLCATAAMVAGLIELVDLMAPLTASWLVGLYRGWIVVLCALGGSVVVLAADVLGRTLARPSEMQVGLLTVFVSLPVLLLMVLRIKGRAS